MLFLSFQATSSDFKLVTTSSGDSALCVNGRAMIVARSNGGWLIGSRTCPDFEKAKPAAVVNSEHPVLITFGFLLSTLGFLLQYLSFPSPKTAAEMRQELKAFQRTEDLKKKINPYTGLPRSPNITPK